MGAILEPTAEMGVYHVEVRRESFWLGAPTAHMVVTANSWSIPTSDVAAVVAALDQVISHPAYAHYSSSSEARVPRAFTAVRESATDRLTITGPGHLYPCGHAGDEHSEGCQHELIELEYRDVDALRRVLAFPSTGGSS